MENENKEIRTVAVLPLRGLVIFPGTILHFDVSRKKSILALTEAMNDNQYIFITAQKNAIDDEPSADDLYSVGVLTKILQIARITDGVFRVVAQGMYRAKVEEWTEDVFISASVSELTVKPAPKSLKTEAQMNVVKSMFEEFAMLNAHVPQDMLLTAQDMSEAGRLADYIADNIIRDYRKKQEILETLNEEKRIEKIVKMFRRETDILAFLLTALCWWQHRENIRRLINGTESKTSF